MDADRIKGKMKDVAGRVERQAGEWTGDKDAQSEGSAKQAEGKVQNTWGNAKDKARDVADDVKDRLKHAGRGERVKDADNVEDVDKEDVA